MTARERQGASRSRVLIVEADEAYRAVIATCVGMAKCNVDAVSDLKTAVEAPEEHSYDLLIWGAAAGERRQVEIIGNLVKVYETPLILLEDELETSQASFEAGATHVLPKPFIPGALVGAIKASLRRAPAMLTQLISRMEIRGMVFEERTLRFDGHSVAFTGQEWELLTLFLAHPNRYLSIREILRLGWRAGEYEGEQVRTYISRLRQKLRPLNLPCQLVSQQGRGYCLIID